MTFRTPAQVFDTFLSRFPGFWASDPLRVLVHNLLLMTFMKPRAFVFQLVFLSLVLASSARAQDASRSVLITEENCPSLNVEVSPHLKLQMHINSRNGSCNGSVSTDPSLPAGANPGTRYYSSSSNRGALIITSVEEIPGETRLSKISGTRAYWFFPRTSQVRIEEHPESQSADLVLINGARLTFDTQAGRIRSFSGGEFVEDSAITLRNNGGVDFRNPRSGLIVDCGWAQGRVAYENPRGTCRVLDSTGHSCTVPNSSLFTYRRLPDGTLLETDFKFTSDSEFAVFLRKQCASLDPNWATLPSSASTNVGAPCSPSLETGVKAVGLEPAQGELIRSLGLPSFN